MEQRATDEVKGQDDDQAEGRHLQDEGWMTIWVWVKMSARTDLLAQDLEGLERRYARSWG
jgi:hypothetical protein